MSLDLNKLSNKLDEALIKETTETLNKFLNDKRMTNNKQQTALEIFWNQLPEILPFTVDTATAVKLDEAYQQAKEMYQDEIEAEIIKQCAEESTSAASSYAEGYTAGYQRALELVEWKIKTIK